MDSRDHEIFRKAGTLFDNYFEKIVLVITDHYTLIVNLITRGERTVKPTADHYNFLINSTICRKQTTILKFQAPNTNTKIRMETVKFLFLLELRIPLPNHQFTCNSNSQITNKIELPKF